MLTRYHSKLALPSETRFDLTCISRKVLTCRVWFVVANYEFFLQSLESEFECLTSTWAQSVNASSAPAPARLQLDLVHEMLGTLEHFLRVWQLRLQFFECQVIPCLETCLKFLTCTFVFQSEDSPLAFGRDRLLRRLLLCLGVFCSSEFCDGELPMQEKNLQNLMTLTMLNAGFLGLLENVYFCSGQRVKLTVWEFFAQLLSGNFRNEVMLKFDKMSVLEVSAYHLEENIGDPWQLFTFWNAGFDFLVKWEKNCSERINSFFKNLIFKLKIENKGDSARLQQIEKFKNLKLAVSQ